VIVGVASGIGAVFYSPCLGFAQSRRFQYVTAQAGVLQSGVQMPQWVPLQ